MSTLHDALNDYVKHLAKAGSFADPYAYMAEKETEFKQAVADAHEKLESHVIALALQVQALTTPAQEPPADPPVDEPPVAVPAA